MSSDAPGRPGIEPRWTSSAKIGVGTSFSADSNVWFTLSHGILNEVYFPRVDVANIRDMGFIVTDGKEFFSEEKADTDHFYHVNEEGVPAYLLTNVCKHGRYRIEKRIITDPRRNVLLQKVTFTPLIGQLSDYKIFALLAPHLANQGSNNHGYVGDYKGIPMLFAEHKAINLAMVASVPFLKYSVGYVGVSDGWQELKKNKELIECYDVAESGNIALTAEIDLQTDQGEFVVAIAFGYKVEECGFQARASLIRGFDAAYDDYIEGWRQTLSRTMDLSQVDIEGGRLYKTSTAVLKIHQGKHFSGSLIASLSIPWGFDKSDDNLGGYHLIWPRDQVETAEAFIATGDLDAARQILMFLMATQEIDGHWPQNMWEDGASFWSKIQLDETALPIMLAGYLKRAHFLKRIDAMPMVEKAASYLIHHGPITEQDRWEEAHGLTPYTLSVVIASMLVAADFFDEKGEESKANYLREAADWWNESIERWLYVKNTPLAEQLDIEGYYIRVNPCCKFEVDPMLQTVVIKNRELEESEYPAWQIISCDALALVRFGLRDANDPKILNTVIAIDTLLKTYTQRGPAWHRYNEDGYGEKEDGSPFDGVGIGRAWPLLTGERALYELAKGNKQEAIRLLRTMASMAGTGGMMPEQVWDTDDIPHKSLFKGHSTGAAKPLVWAHAEYIRVLRSLQDNKICSTPPQTVARYIKNKKPAKYALWQQEAQFTHCPAGKILRIQLPDDGFVKWTADGWQTHQETLLVSNGFTDYYCDIPMPEKIEFTAFSASKNSWLHQNWSVSTIKPE